MLSLLQKSQYGLILLPVTQLRLSTMAAVTLAHDMIFTLQLISSMLMVLTYHYRLIGITAAIVESLVL